tara:strand:- start:2250 stop:3002 length:753 start_codon:yes stop_codon:yes gene_type:complete
MKILGISGRKQSGKNTTANILHGISLKNNGLIKDWNISQNGGLMILTENKDGKEGWGEFDVSRRDESFVQYAEHNMWPYVKLYSFADHLKLICLKLFDIPRECLWGTDEEKNLKQDHLRWENMPCLEMFNNPKRKGAMTSREFMQFFGTDVMRKMYEPVWVKSCLATIQDEKSELAIIADVRFPNEAKAIQEVGGNLVRLTRRVFEDNHSSEIALDKYPFTDIIDNSENSIDGMMVKVSNFYSSLQETKC